MSLLSFNINLNHRFFLIFLPYFLREVALEGIDKIFEKDEDKFIFGNSKKTKRKLFYIYIYKLSKLFFFLLQLLID